MTPKHLCILLLALVAAGVALGQNEDIPVENDNQFPPDNRAEPDAAGDIIEGSGAGAIEEPIATNSKALPIIPLEEMQPTVLSVNVSSDGELCPKQCVCHTVGDNFVVECSGYGLAEFPSPLNPKTTTLNIQNNKLTEIPKDVSALKNLKVLNAENNLIMQLASGSISELSELILLKLANNRLIEFPQDLKNSFGLTKLEEIDLGRNDMRTELKADVFEIFKSLRKLTLPTSTPELLEDLCGTLNETLETVCTGTCDTEPFDCPDAPGKLDEDLLDATLPGMIPLTDDLEEDNADPVVNSAKVGDTKSGVEDTPQVPLSNTKDDVTVPASGEPANNAAPRSRAGTKDKEESIPMKSNSIVADVPPTEVSSKTETDVQVGATTTSTTTGGVDKSVIGFIVAGMVLVVAGITIKKNWGSIKNRFSSSPRPPNDRGGANANGTTPEEVPLQDKQDKSPV